MFIHTQAHMILIIIIITIIKSGDWMAIMVHILRQFGFFDADKIPNTDYSHPTNNSNAKEAITSNHGSWFHFAGWSIFGSYLIYYGLGGFLHVSIID